MLGRLPRLHIVTDDEVLSDDRFQRTAAEIMMAGGSRVALHLRARNASGREMFRHASACAEVARGTGSTLIINDRVDVAIACEAVGVQLGGDSLPVGAARSLLGLDRWIGASIHSRSGADEARAGGADFVLAGTLYETPSHPGRRPAGLDWLSQPEPLELPIIGIGGITPERVGEVRRAGAHGVAVIRGIWAARSPLDALASYLAELE